MESAAPMRDNKQIRRLVRGYAEKAHERELREALAPLADAFRAWESGELDSFEVSALSTASTKARRATSTSATRMLSRLWRGPSPAACSIGNRCPLNCSSTSPA